jgi:hypothetical protein
MGHGKSTTANLLLDVLREGNEDGEEFEADESAHAVTKTFK